jgi:hypothetical protein
MKADKLLINRKRLKTSFRDLFSIIFICWCKTMGQIMNIPVLKKEKISLVYQKLCKIMKQPPIKQKRNNRILYHIF